MAGMTKVCFIVLLYAQVMQKRLFQSDKSMVRMPSVWVIHESWPQDQLDHYAKEAAFRT